MLKTLENLFEVAPLNRMRQVIDANGAVRPSQLEDWYKSVNSIVLGEAVPEAVSRYFDAAKNVLLYSWFAYEMVPAAELYSYAILEKALKIRLKREDNRIGLKKLLKMAVEQRLVNDSGFHIPRNQVRQNMFFEEGELKIEYMQRSEEELKLCTEYAEMLCESVPSLRNYYAHGAAGFGPYGLMTLRINAEIINMLFEGEKGQFPDLSI